MKGFKHTGKGPKYGSFSFSSKAGFTGSTGKQQEVRGYVRSIPKKKFSHGGPVTTPMASGDSSVIKRTKPVTSFDAEHGGKSPLRPGFNKGGEACMASGGRTMGMRPRNAGPVKPPPAPTLSAPAPSPMKTNQRFGNFSRRPLFG